MRTITIPITGTTLTDEQAQQAALAEAVDALTIVVDGHEQAPGPLTFVRVTTKQSRVMPRKRPFITPPPGPIVRRFTFAVEDGTM